MALNLFLITVLISSMFYCGDCRRKTLRGKPYFERSNRIIGGYLIEIQDAAYQVTVLSEQKLYPFCGGSIISKKHILTAAHCIETNGPYFILAGSDTYNKGTKYEVAKVAKHPKFGKEQPRYDIAVLTLAKELEFNNNVSKVDLPKKDEQFKVKSFARVTGFGATIEEGRMQRKLRAVDIPTWSAAECQKNELYVPDTLCAGLEEGLKDACQGDSGGPLVLGNKLIGIVSYGKGCGRASSPGIYTDVAKYIDYIMTESNNLRG